MNDLDYLRQISSTSAPAPKPSLFDGKMKLLAVVLGFILVLAIVLLSLSSTPTESTVDSELSRLYLRSQSLLTSLSTYTPHVASSSLRATGSSLSVVLTDLNTNTGKTLTETYGLSTDKLALPETDSAQLDSTNEILEKARLNAILDRYYASQLSYQIGYLLIIEDSILKKSKDESINSYISSSKENLTRLDETLTTFSEAN